MRSFERCHWVIQKDGHEGVYLSPRRLQGRRYSGHMEREEVALCEADVFTNRASATRAAYDGFSAVPVILVPSAAYDEMREKASKYDDLCK